MTCKIYLEPRALFDPAIIEDTVAKTTYCYFKIIDLLVLDRKKCSAVLDQEEYTDADIMDEYYWYNIEPLKSYYHIDFVYDHDKYLGDDSWNIQL